jgi:hypothetical protein
MGSTSFAKSTLAGVWADNIPAKANEQSDGRKNLNSRISPPQGMEINPFRVGLFYINLVWLGERKTEGDRNSRREYRASIRPFPQTGRDAETFSGICDRNRSLTVAAPARSH